MKYARLWNAGVHFWEIDVKEEDDEVDEYSRHGRFGYITDVLAAKYAAAEREYLKVCKEISEGLHEVNKG